MASRSEDLTAQGTGDILVIDDDLVDRLAVVHCLAGRTHRVTQVSSGSDALARLDEKAFDLVLLDVVMPDMDGFEVCRRIRRRFNPQALPIIFLTAKADISELLAHGNDYLIKPVGEEELLARVRIHLDAKWAHHQLDDLVAERDRLVEEVTERNAELARFNYTVSHDLKNPLTTVKNFTGLIRRDLNVGDVERVARNLDRVERAANRLERMLNELFQLSRIGHRPGAMEEVHFGEMVKDVVASLEEALHGKGVEVRQAEVTSWVQGHPVHLSKVVHQLFENALQFFGDQETPWIEVGEQPSEDGSRDPVFYVRDNGKGIAPQYHDRIFGLFERLDPTASEGTGVGLAMVRRIIEFHRGQVWVESDGEGFGSTFLFTIPRAE